jgi:hypothetical protein
MINTRTRDGPRRQRKRASKMRPDAIEPQQAMSAY